MKPFSEALGSDLQWTQPSALAREYELRAGEQTVARLVFRSAFGTLATGECESGCWTFKRVGFFSQKVTVRPCESASDVAEFRNNTWSRGGTLGLPDGRRYLVDVNFWMTQFQIGTEAGAPLVAFRRIGGAFHLSSSVELHSDPLTMPDLPWFVILGWYLTVMLHSDAASAAAM